MSQVAVAVAAEDVQAQPRRASRPVAAHSVVTRPMLTAGRQAFKRERKNLSDLYDYFDCDLDQFLIVVFSAMAGAA